MDRVTRAAFFDELEKIGGLTFTLGNPEKAEVTAGGLFVGGVPTDQHEATREELMRLLSEHGSLLKAHEAYSSAHPDQYATYAIRRQAPPGGVRHALGKFFGTKGSKQREEEWSRHSTGPKRFFINISDRSGGPEQSEFYNDVRRGLYHHELPEGTSPGSGVYAGPTMHNLKPATVKGA